MLLNLPGGAHDVCPTASVLLNVEGNFEDSLQSLDETVEIG